MAFSFKHKLITTTTLAAALFGGYMRRAYAVQCYNGVPRAYLCSGTYTNKIVLSDMHSASVTAADGFSINVPSSTAIKITGDGALSFTDLYQSAIIDGNKGLEIVSSGNDYVYGYDGAININMNTSINAEVGIDAANVGSGGMQIFFDGDITSTQLGIYATNFGGDTNITAGANSTIRAATGTAIFALNYGAGGTSVVVDGYARGGSDGVYVKSYGQDVSVTTGASSYIYGYNAAIHVNSQYTGSTTINVGGTLYGFYNGINAYSRYTTDGMSISTGAGSYIRGRVNGILATHNGTGDLSLSIEGGVIGETGIVARKNGSGAGNLSVTTYDSSNIVSATGVGIKAYNEGYGATNIILHGDIDALSHGLVTISGQNTTDMTLYVGAESMIDSEESYGIVVDHHGTGAASITANGSVYGWGTGIYAVNFGTDLIVNTGADSLVSGANKHGMRLLNWGSGDLDIDIGGDVSGDETGVYAVNYDQGIDMSVRVRETSVINGINNFGIRAVNGGTGKLDMVLDGNITGRNTGVDIMHGGADLAVAAGVDSIITGTYENGLVAKNYGSGYLSMTIDGEVTGATNGVYARNENGTDLTINTGADSRITGTEYYGLVARSYGSGNLSLTVDGEITGASGIFVRNAGINMTVGLGADSVITAQNGYGIYARSVGSGFSSITAGGHITSAKNGIFALNYGTDLSINTDVDSEIISTGSYGIVARNFGSGALSLTLNGDLTGTNGVIAQNDGSGDLTVNVGTDAVITGTGYYGMNIRNNGASDLRIVADGEIFGEYRALFVNNHGVNLNILTGAYSRISADYSYAVYAGNHGTGLLSMTADGYARGGRFGIYLSNNQGTGLSLVTGSGSTSIGTNDAGVFVRNYSGYLSFTAHGNISGDRGIDIINKGTSSTGIVTDAIIEGTGGTAIDFRGYSGTSRSTTATPITIAGGRIIGDVVDHYSDLGFSPVTVTGDFTSEGNFEVSGFRVSSTGDFTLGNANNSINSHSGVQVDGKFTVDGIGTSSKSGVFSVNNGGSFYVNEDFGIDGQFLSGGKTHIATGKELHAETMQAGASGDLYFGFNTSTDHALLTIANGAADLTNQTLHIDVTGVTGLATNEQALLISGQGAIIGGPGGTAAAVDDNSVLWNFRVVDGTGIAAPTSNADLFLIAAQSAPVSQLADTPNNAAAGNVLMGLQNTNNPELAAIVGNMNGASTEAEFNEILEATQPAADMAEAAVMMGFSERMMDTVSDRLTTLREGDMGDTSIVSGLSETRVPMPQPSGLQVWAVNFGDSDNVDGHGAEAFNSKEWQAAFGRYSRQNARDGIDGYEASVGGLAVGVDTGRTYNDMILGLALSYAHTEVNAFNANRSETAIDGFQLLFYGTRLLPNNAYIDIMASYGQNQNDNTRHNVGGVPGLTAKGDFTSYETGLSASVGHHLNWNGYTVTPSLTLGWLHYSADSYTETGAGGANLSVNTQSLDSVQLGPSIKVSKSIARDNGAAFLPEIHVGYSYDLSGDPLQKTAQFTGGGAAFTTQSPDPVRHRFNAGFGIGYSAGGNWDYSLTYDLDTAQGFQSHAIMAKAAWMFN